MFQNDGRLEKETQGTLFWPFWGIYSLNFKLCIHNFPFHSEIENLFFFFSGCPIPQFNVFGDDLSSVNWGYHCILHIPAINHIVSRVPAINSITPTIHSPIDRFFGFQTLPRRQQTHSLTNVSHLFVFFFESMLGWWPFHGVCHAHRYIYIYISYCIWYLINYKILYIISRQVVAMSHDIIWRNIV